MLVRAEIIGQRPSSQITSMLQALHILQQLHKEVHVGGQFLLVDVLDDVVLLAVQRRLAAFHAHQMGNLAAMLRRIRCSAFLAEQRTGCHLDAGSLRSLANVALHTRRRLRGLQETLALDHGQIAGADGVDIDDERTSQLGLMGFKERPHAGVLSELGAQSHEPHLGIDIGVAELVHLVELLVQLDGRRHRCGRWHCKPRWWAG